MISERRKIRRSRKKDQRYGYEVRRITTISRTEKIRYRSSCRILSRIREIDDVYHRYGKYPRCYPIPKSAKGV